jgi:hypothetical protein
MLKIALATATFPVWGSWLGVIAAAALSIWAFRLMFQWQRTHRN